VTPTITGTTAFPLRDASARRLAKAFARGLLEGERSAKNPRRTHPRGLLRALAVGAPTLSTASAIVTAKDERRQRDPSSTTAKIPTGIREMLADALRALDRGGAHRGRGNPRAAICVTSELDGNDTIVVGRRKSAGRRAASFWSAFRGAVVSARPGRSVRGMTRQKPTCKIASL